MRSLDVSDANFKSERDVVKEERRLRIDNPPFGRLLRGGARQHLHHPPLPHPADRQHRRPRRRDDRGRARLPPHLLRAQQRHPGGRGRLRPGAGPWAGSRSTSAPSPRARPIPREIAARSRRRRPSGGLTDHHANTPLPAVLLTYHVPEAGHTDLYALEVASNILSGGESSRLYRRLVYEKQIALAAGGQAIVLEDPGRLLLLRDPAAGAQPPRTARRSSSPRRSSG